MRKIAEFYTSYLIKYAFRDAEQRSGLVVISGDVICDTLFVDDVGTQERVTARHRSYSLKRESD